MAESAVADAPDTEQADSFDYPVEVADAGPAAKKVTVTVPASRIDEHEQSLYGEIGKDAVVPGFRRGKAPKSIVRKKFSKAVRDQVQQDMLRESYQHALQTHDLKPLGDPEFEDAENLKLPDSGDLSYSFTVEVRPEFTMPSLDGLTIKKPKIVIKDEHVDQALENLRNQQGTLGPVEGRGVKEGDYLFADVKMVADGKTLAEQQDARLVARGGKIANISVDDFAQKVEGMNVGEERSFDIQIPDDFANELLRGKTASVTIQLKDVRELTPAVVDQPFLEDLGFDHQDGLMEALREQMEERVQNDVKNVMRRQAREYLVKNTELELPEKMSAKQEDRVVNRRAMTLLQRGISEEKVRAAVDKLREGASEEAKTELKAFFILDKIVEEKGLELDESEINGQVAMLAIEREERPEALRDRMAKDGSLQNLAQGLMEQKALDAVIADAKVEEVEPTAKQEKEAVEGVDPDADVEDVEDVT
jgi:trigger factor